MINSSEGTIMDQIQQLLCNTLKQKSDCFVDRNIFRAVLADCLPNNKLKQNLLLNAFDNDIVQNLRNGVDVTLIALNYISQLENDYGITKDAAFWSVQTWCYLLGLDTVATALVVMQPTNQATVQATNIKDPMGNEYKIGLGVYRAGTDFPAGEISVQITTKPRLKIFYGVGKNPNRVRTEQDFMDKIYVNIEEGQFLKLHSFESEAKYTFIVKLIK